jgi:hypothetical protein
VERLLANLELDALRSAGAGGHISPGALSLYLKLTLLAKRNGGMDKKASQSEGCSYSHRVGTRKYVIW